jgi:hypothetical protein
MSLSLSSIPSLVYLLFNSVRYTDAGQQMERKTTMERTINVLLYRLFPPSVLKGDLLRTECMRVFSAAAQNDEQAMNGTFQESSCNLGPLPS